MYEAFWNLSRKPFTYRTATADCWPVADQRAALLRLNYCVENSAGCALLLGDSGLGKSTLLKILEAEHDRLRPFVRLAFPGLEPTEQLRMLTGQLSQMTPTPGSTADELLLSILSALRHYCQESGQHPIICFDDAQLLTGSVLNDVVLALLNLREMDECVDFTVILSGQPILASQIARQAQLRERTAVTARLTGMTLNETADYVTSSVRNAGSDKDIFTAEAITRLHEVSQGNPRRLNRLCDMALLVACGEHASQISADQIESVSTELLTAA